MRNRGLSVEEIARLKKAFLYDVVLRPDFQQFEKKKKGDIIPYGGTREDEGDCFFLIWFVFLTGGQHKQMWLWLNDMQF